MYGHGKTGFSRRCAHRHYLGGHRITFVLARLMDFLSVMSVTDNSPGVGATEPMRSHRSEKKGKI